MRYDGWIILTFISIYEKNISQHNYTGKFPNKRFDFAKKIRSIQENNIPSSISVTKCWKRNFEIVSNRIIIISASNLLTKFINSTANYTGKFPNKRFNFAKKVPSQYEKIISQVQSSNEKEKESETFDLGPPTLVLHQHNRIVLHAI